MKAENIKLASLKTAHDCMDALDAIEHDRRNYACSDREWLNGQFDLRLKAIAKRKYVSINRKLYNLPDDEL